MTNKDSEESEIVHEFVGTFNKAAPDFPLMFKGTMDKAISASWPKNIKSGAKKVLILFVQKGLGDEFAEFVKCMSSRRMKMILMESFIVWGWDIESPDRLNKLEDIVTAKLKDVANQIVPDLKEEQFPKLFLLRKSHEVICLAHKISAPYTEDQMFLELEAVVSPIVRASLDKLEPMNLREKRKSSSARKDTLGDRIEKRASSIAEQQKQRRMLGARMSVQGVPQEPAPDEPGVISIKFIAHEASHERRFSQEDTVDGVISYLISIGYSPDAYRFMGRKSRTDIGKVNRDLRLKALQMGKNEVIAIEAVNRNKSMDFLSCCSFSIVETEKPRL